MYFTNRRLLSKMVSMMLIFGSLAACSKAPDLQPDTTSVEASSLSIVTPVVTCESLTSLDLSAIGGTGSTVTSAKTQQYNGANACVVEGNLAPSVGFKVILPADTWTQRYLQVGCGGLCGMLNLNIGAAEGCAPVENNEFVLATTDMGHRGMGADFGQTPQKRIDFAYRAVHITAQTAKALIQRFYGQAPRYSYFTGCSDGGREGLVEAQRYPDDFNGILAGAPAMNFSVQNSFYHGWQASANTDNTGNPILRAEDMPILYKAAIEACDSIDGLKDGLIANPLDCDFDPATTLCDDKQQDGCLSAGQVTAARQLYAGPKDPKTGEALTLGGPQPGSELSWVGVFVPQPGSERIFSAMIAEGAVRNLIFKNNPPADYQLSDFTFDATSFNQIKPLYGLYSGANPDLSAFAAAGGKLMLWHGWSDPHISPYNTIRYYEITRDVLGDKADQFMQLYLFPGMYHCAKGTGPYNMDMLTAMMAWVEKGIKPEKIIASHPGNSNTEEAAMGSPDGHAAAEVITDYLQRSRPVYPYPLVATYTGTGDVNDAGHFTPVPGTRLTSYDWAGEVFMRPGPPLNCFAAGSALNCSR